jgi:hypothetical protein
MEFGWKEILAILSIVVSVYVFLKTKSGKAYTDVDGMYMQLLKIAMDNPCLRKPDKIMSIKEEEERIIQKEKYDLYAYMVWNFIETIYDNSWINVSETWQPTIQLEAQLHKMWLKEEGNQKKFKIKFLQFIKKEKYVADLEIY